mmetsp:Transcript_6549/g.23068  ORF Transcript_6549/g.23068 Transcript_6549/m.23068 type:complete len:356 (+) Transcript_6549:1821-2888(+)
MACLSTKVSIVLDMNGPPERSHELTTSATAWSICLDLTARHLDSTRSALSCELGERTSITSHSLPCPSQRMRSKLLSFLCSCSAVSCFEKVKEPFLKPPITFIIKRTFAHRDLAAALSFFRNISCLLCGPSILSSPPPSPPSSPPSPSSEILRSPNMCITALILPHLLAPVFFSSFVASVSSEYIQLLWRARGGRGDCVPGDTPLNESAASPGGAAATSTFSGGTPTSLPSFSPLTVPLGFTVTMRMMALRRIHRDRDLRGLTADLGANWSLSNTEGSYVLSFRGAAFLTPDGSMNFCTACLDFEYTEAECISTLSTGPRMLSKRSGVSTSSVTGVSDMYLCLDPAVDFSVFSAK